MMLASNLYAITNKHIVALVILMIGFMISETAVVKKRMKVLVKAILQTEII